MIVLKKSHTGEESMNTTVITVGEGRYQIEVQATRTQDGLIVHLLGGEKPHVGAVAISVPRPKKNGEGFTVDTWLSPIPGHKDGDIAKPTAERIARQRNENVVVIAGVHISNATKEEINKLVANSLEAVELLIEKLEVQNA